jgi:hypothetical protein
VGWALKTEAINRKAPHDCQDTRGFSEQENFMATQNKASKQTNKTSAPQTGNLAREIQREKAEKKEVAGRHKNDGQKDHKGSR